MINSVTITGHLGDNPKAIALESGLAIANFSIAINEVRGKGADRKEVTHWVDCTAFGLLAETIHKYLSKGSKVTVAGRLSQQKWESQDGKKMSKIIVIVDNIAFMSQKNSGTDTEAATEEAAA
jgi:single-strand DNA-binding protein